MNIKKTLLLAVASIALLANSLCAINSYRLLEKDGHKVLVLGALHVPLLAEINKSHVHSVFLWAQAFLGDTNHAHFIFECGEGSYEDFINPHKKDSTTFDPAISLLCGYSLDASARKHFTFQANDLRSATNEIKITSDVTDHLLDTLANDGYDRATIRQTKLLLKKKKITLTVADYKKHLTKLSALATQVAQQHSSVAMTAALESFNENIAAIHTFFAENTTEKGDAADLIDVMAAYLKKQDNKAKASLFLEELFSKKIDHALAHIGFWGTVLQAQNKSNNPTIIYVSEPHAKTLGKWLMQDGYQETTAKILFRPISSNAYSFPKTDTEMFLKSAQFIDNLHQTLAQLFGIDTSKKNKPVTKVESLDISIKNDNDSKTTTTTTTTTTTKSSKNSSSKESTKQVRVKKALLCVMCNSEPATITCGTCKTPAYCSEECKEERAKQKKRAAQKKKKAQKYHMKKTNTED